MAGKNILIVSKRKNNLLLLIVFIICACSTKDDQILCYRWYDRYDTSNHKMLIVNRKDSNDLVTYEYFYNVQNCDTLPSWAYDKKLGITLAENGLIFNKNYFKLNKRDSCIRKVFDKELNLEFSICIYDKVSSSRLKWRVLEVRYQDPPIDHYDERYFISLSSNTIERAEYFINDKIYIVEELYPPLASASL